MRQLRLLLAVILAVPGHAPAQDANGELQIGIQQVTEGNFDEALITLDRVVRQLTPDAATNASRLSRAHLYKGIAYVGMRQEEPAKAEFRNALYYDPALRLKKGEHPDRVVRIFDAARTGKEKSVLERPNTTVKKAGIGTGAVVAIVGGALAAAGGVAVAAGGGGNAPPTGSLMVSPDGQGIMSVTVFSFTASLSDPDGDSISVTWNFGDGSTGSGTSATHVFAREGTFSVTGTASDGTAETVLSTSVTVRSLSGSWIQEDVPFSAAMHLVQEGAAVRGSYSLSVTSGERTEAEGPVSGSVSNPRNIELLIQRTRTVPCCAPFPPFHYLLAADSTLNILTGTETNFGQAARWRRAQ